MPSMRRNFADSMPLRRQQLSGQLLDLGWRGDFAEAFDHLAKQRFGSLSFGTTSSAGSSLVVFSGNQWSLKKRSQSGANFNSTPASLRLRRCNAV